MISFDERTHTYRNEKGIVPSVTQIIKRLSQYNSIPRSVLQVASARGTAIHTATEYRDQGTLDYASLDDEILDYVLAYEAFLRQTKPEIIAIEKMVHEPSIGYAGTLDRVYRIGGKISLVDIKSTTTMMPGVGPQLAAYEKAYNLTVPRAEKITRRYGLQLKRDGSYELHPYTDVQDWNAFLACLTLNNFESRIAA